MRCPVQTLLSPKAIIDAELCESVQRVLGVEELRVGRHVLRDAQRLRSGQMFVRKLWIAKVQPPAYPAACLGTIVADQQTTVILAAPDVSVGGEVLVTSSLLRFGPEWPDPVADVLMSFDLWSGSNEISLSGCSYVLFVDTAQIQTAVRFSNPRHPGRLALQTALMKVARFFLTADSSQAATAFLDRWDSAISGARSEKRDIELIEP